MSHLVSRQQFTVTIAAGATSGTATITSVNTARAFVVFNGWTTPNTGTALREHYPRVELTDTTTVTAFRNTSNATHAVTVYGEVWEFASGTVSTVQQGTITIASGATSGTATISSVTTTRAVAFHLGQTVSTTTSSAHLGVCRIDLTNSTTVTATRGASSTAVVTAGYVVVEFDSAAIQSVQQRSVTMSTSATSATDTLPTAVTTANTLIVYQGVSGGTTTRSNWTYGLELTNTTTVTLTRTGTTTTSRTVNYTALEFASGVLTSKQTGTTAVASATSATTAITSVSSTLGGLMAVGFSTTAAANGEAFAAAALTSTTQVTGYKGVAGSSTSTPYWQVVEIAQYTPPAGSAVPVFYYHLQQQGIA